MSRLQIRLGGEILIIASSTCLCVHAAAIRRGLSVYVAGYATPEVASRHFLISFTISSNNTGATVVPEGYVFVLGDNRSNSEDSRSVQTHGLVPVGNIVARATDIVWSSDVRRIRKWIGSPGSL